MLLFKVYLCHNKINKSCFKMISRKNFFNFYKAKLIYPDKKPNMVLIVLAKLEEIGILKSVITQNIDRLYQAATELISYFKVKNLILNNNFIKLKNLYL